MKEKYLVTYVATKNATPTTVTEKSAGRGFFESKTGKFGEEQVLSAEESIKQAGGFDSVTLTGFFKLDDKSKSDGE